MAETSGSPAPVRSAARGLAGAMMMSAFRQATVHLGLVEEPPPETMVREGTPGALERLDKGKRKALTELAHWTYGAGGGAAYGLLPAALRRQPWAGPAYGVALWLSYELVLAPLLGERHPQGKVVGRAMVALDHVLYGLVVGGRFPPRG